VEILAFIFGMMGFIMGIFAYLRTNAIKKKLKEAGVFDKNFNSENEI
jgi:hypothetical protein